jgi:ribonuclease P protein component
MRFTRKDRLSTKAAFRNVFSSPLVSRDQYFKVLAQANSREYCRLGMAVSRKNCRHAVGRNRLKRVIRENFRNHMVDRGGFDYVVLPTAQAATISNRVLNRSLQEHWQKAPGAGNHRVMTDNRKDQ